MKKILLTFFIVLSVLGFSACSSNSDNPVSPQPENQIEETQYHFRSEKYLNEHYKKHGIDMGFASAKEYEEAASSVINNPDALYKIEAEDGDGVYYLEDTNEFVILSKNGYIRTYFFPDAGKSYYDRQ